MLVHPLFKDVYWNMKQTRAYYLMTWTTEMWVAYVSAAYALSDRFSSKLSNGVDVEDEATCN